MARIKARKALPETHNEVGGNLSFFGQLDWKPESMGETVVD
jgi:hypothetical protein